jgi:polysaccharide pyruvyl transferase WcaK-like protein
MKQNKVLLLGSYGQSNLGDDLLMWNYLQFLQTHGATEIYVNANTTKYIPEAVKKAFPNIKVINTYKTPLLQYVQLIKKVDYILYGGGTLYKELYASTGRSRYSVIIRLMGFNFVAKLLGTRVYHLHIGIGSLKTKVGRFITKLALTFATKTIFRDKQSFEFARDTLKVPAGKIARSVDGLFIDPIWQTPWHKKPLKIDRKKYKRVVGINVLSDIPDWIDREAYVKTMQQFVTALLKKGDFVVFIPFQTAFNARNDLVFMSETFKKQLQPYSNYELLSDVPIDLVHSYMTQCDILVGMRFHSLLLATVCQLPFVAIAYDTKCWRYIEEINYPYALQLENLSYDTLMQRYEETFKNKAAIRSQLQNITKQMYNQAEDGLRTLNL